MEAELNVPCKLVVAKIFCKLSATASWRQTFASWFARTLPGVIGLEELALAGCPHAESLDNWAPPDRRVTGMDMTYSFAGKARDIAGWNRKGQKAFEHKQVKPISENQVWTAEEAGLYWEQFVNMAQHLLHVREEHENYISLEDSMWFDECAMRILEGLIVETLLRDEFEHMDVLTFLLTCLLYTSPSQRAS